MPAGIECADLAENLYKGISRCSDYNGELDSPFRWSPFALHGIFTISEDFRDHSAYIFRRFRISIVVNSKRRHVSQRMKRKFEENKMLAEEIRLYFRSWQQRTQNTTTQSLASATRFQCFPLTQSLRLSLMAFHAKILCRAPDKPFPTVTSPYSMEIFFIFQNCQILRNFTESHSASFQGWFPATKTVSSPTLAQ